MKILYKILILTSFAIIYISCDDTVTVQDIDNRIIPDSNVSYTKDIRPILEVKCVSCHGTNSVEGGVNLTEWTYFVDNRIVVRGEPDNSILVWVLEEKAGYSHLGKTNYIPMTANQVRGVKTWIAEGAQNN